MKQDDTKGRELGDLAASDLEDRREARRLARQNRQAQRRMQRRAENAPLPVGKEEPRRPTAVAARSSNLVGPFAKRVGRIGGNMILGQVIKMLLGAVLRR